MARCRPSGGIRRCHPYLKYRLVQCGKSHRVIEARTAAFGQSTGPLIPQRFCTPHQALGYFNVKARRLKHFISFLRTRYQGNLQHMVHEPTADLREALLSVNGIGPETADSILLYALQMPIFVIDIYTKRMFSCHGLIRYEGNYEEYQRLFMMALPPDAPLDNQYHAMLVHKGKDFCRSRPRCEVCPLSCLRCPY